MPDITYSQKGNVPEIKAHISIEEIKEMLQSPIERIKELIIRGGVNISPFEIDEVLSDCPYIISGISVGFENSWYGEEIGAVVILKDEYKNGNREHLESEIKKYCWKQLPFNKVPKVIKFLEELPVTSTGKYQRNRVKDLFEEYKDKRFLRFAL